MVVGVGLTVIGVVIVQPVEVRVKVTISVPVELPITEPVALPTVAKPPEPAHVPAPVASVRVMVEPTHTELDPPIGAGALSTVTTCVAKQPVGNT